MTEGESFGWESSVEDGGRREKRSSHGEVEGSQLQKEAVVVAPRGHQHIYSRLSEQETERL